MSCVLTFMRTLRGSPFVSYSRPCHAVVRPGTPTRLVFGAPRGSTRASSSWSVRIEPSTKQKPLPRFFKVAGMTGLGLGISLWGAGNKIHCEASPETRATVPPATASPAPLPLPPSPQSSVNLYELSFGTVCGVCAGIFMKKGAKAAAFVLGGVFVLLQYLGSLSLVRVDWTRMSTRFENLFYRQDGEIRKPPSIVSVMRWLIDFLTADFQQRASFVAGFALGLRVG